MSVPRSLALLVALASILLLVGTPGAAAGQVAPALLPQWSSSPVPSTDTARPAADEASLALGGLLGIFPGVVGGALVGAVAERGVTGCRTGDEWCGFTGGIVGAAFGAGVGVALGVHWTDRRRGDLGRTLLATTLVSAAGVAATFAFNDARPLFVLPLGQIVAAVAAERAGAR